ncbi:MAG: spore coat protein [Massiliimalia sp.]|jgi:hypothetical protein
MADLTQNEFDFIEEQLRQEELMMRKFSMYARLCDDPQLKQKCQQVAARHQNHYLRLLNHLN